MLCALLHAKRLAARIKKQKQKTHHHQLGVRVHLALPAVQRRDAGDDVGARDEARVEQRARDALAFVLIVFER